MFYLLLTWTQKNNTQKGVQPAAYGEKHLPRDYHHLTVSLLIFLRSAQEKIHWATYQPAEVLSEEQYFWGVSVINIPKIGKTFPNNSVGNRWKVFTHWKLLVAIKVGQTQNGIQFKSFVN